MIFASGFDLERLDDGAGSAAMTRSSGFLFFKYSESPVMVPPVPAMQTR